MGKPALPLTIPACEETAHLPGFLQVWGRSLSVFHEDVLSAALGVCRGLMSPVSAWAAVFGHTSVPQRRSEVAVGTLLFSAWKLSHRGSISDPSGWQPLTMRQSGLVMDLTALSQPGPGKRGADTGCFRMDFRGSG